MIGSVGLSGITGIFWLINFLSEGFPIDNFLSRIFLILWIENFLLVKSASKWAFFKIDSIGRQWGETMLPMLSIFIYHTLSSDAIYFTTISVFQCYLISYTSYTVFRCYLFYFYLFWKKPHFEALFTNKNFSIHKIKKMREQKLPKGDPSDRKFISQNIPVIPDNPTEPNTSKALFISIYPNTVTWFLQNSISICVNV